MAYCFLDHRADVKFRAEGTSLEEMFVSCVDALNETIYGEMEVLEQEERCFEVEGLDKVSLLYSFLEEFLVILDKDGFVVNRVVELKINLEKNTLRCVVVGDVVENYAFTNDVKAVTYSEMLVEERGGKWVGQVVLDV